MKTRNKIIQQRPNTSVSFFDANQAFKDLKTTYVEENKLDDQGASWSDDQLIKTWTLVFPTNDDYLEFKSNSLCEDYIASMSSYNTTNSISYSIELDEIE